MRHALSLAQLQIWSSLSIINVISNCVFEARSQCDSASEAATAARRAKCWPRLPGPEAGAGDNIDFQGAGAE